MLKGPASINDKTWKCRSHNALSHWAIISLASLLPHLKIFLKECGFIFTLKRRNSKWEIVNGSKTPTWDSVNTDSFLSFYASLISQICYFPSAESTISAPSFCIVMLCYSIQHLKWSFRISIKMDLFSFIHLCNLQEQRFESQNFIAHYHPPQYYKEQPLF